LVAAVNNRRASGNWTVNLAESDHQLAERPEKRQASGVKIQADFTRLVGYDHEVVWDCGWRVGDPFCDPRSRKSVKFGGFGSQDRTPLFLAETKHLDGVVELRERASSQFLCWLWRNNWAL